MRFLRSPFGLVLRRIFKLLSIFVPFEKGRRFVREFFDYKSAYRLKQYFARYVPKPPAVEPKLGPKSDYVFQCWLQGVENAPAVVKKCMESVRYFSKGKKYVLITIENWQKYVDLPDFILEKYKAGIISHAHFADILRLCLLCKYGGYWIDATCLMTADFPTEIEKLDDFMYYSDGQFYWTLINNCFIYARPNSYLMTSWRDAMFNFWKNEDKYYNYFFAHIMFQTLLKKNALAGAEFKKIPVVMQTRNHRLLSVFFNEFDEKLFYEIISESFIHKLSYKVEKHQKVCENSFKKFVEETPLDYILKSSPR
ncbi:MAG: capsular polysaccharide synthesis protein [bacterium]|nr:capsular polysaccharide synthesis protein [bacterium]